MNLGLLKGSIYIANSEDWNEKQKCCSVYLRGAKETLQSLHFYSRVKKQKENKKNIKMKSHLIFHFQKILRKKSYFN